MESKLLKYTQHSKKISSHLFAISNVTILVDLLLLEIFVANGIFDPRKVPRVDSDDLSCYGEDSVVTLLAIMALRYLLRPYMVQKN